MDVRFELPPLRLCGQALLFAWRMCLFFSPIVLSFSTEPPSCLVSGRAVFLLACMASLTALALFEKKASSKGQGFSVLSGVVLAAGGTALAVFGLSGGVSSLAVALCGFIVAGVGDSLLALSYGRLYSQLSVKLSMRVVPFALVLAALLYAAVVNSAPVVAVPVTVALPVACGAILLFDLSSARSSGSTGAAEPLLEDPEKARFTKWKISFYTAVLWLSFGIMWSLAAGKLFGDGRLFGTFSLSVAALMALVALVVAALTYVLKLPTAKTFWIFVPLTVAGISVVAVIDSNAQVFAFALVFAARGIAEMQLITHFAALCRRRGHCVATLFAGGFAILSGGEALGVIAGSAIAGIGSMELTMVLLVCANVIVVAVILSIFRVNATFQKAELESALAKQASSHVSAPQQDSRTVEDVVRAWAKGRGLSAREEEVAALLLSGRNVPAIAEMLCISQSTVHTHVKHIYEKLGVHTRQELIDLRDDELET